MASRRASRSLQSRSTSRTVSNSARSELSSTGLFISDGEEEDVVGTLEEDEELGKRVLSRVLVPPKPRRWLDTFEALPGEETVRKVLRQTTENGEVAYEVRFEDFHTDLIPLDRVIELENGSAALETFNNDQNSATDSDEYQESEDEIAAARPSRATTARRNEYVDSATFQIDSEDEPVEAPPRRARGGPARRSPRQTRQTSRPSSLHSLSGLSSDEIPKRRSVRRLSTRSSVAPNNSRRSLRFAQDAEDFDDQEEDESSEEGDVFKLRSDVLPRVSMKRKRASNGPSRPEKVLRTGTRHSERDNRHRNNMAEVGEDAIYRSDSDGVPIVAAPKVTGLREVFEVLPRNDEFRMRHMQQ
ncbi:hypothetical protein LTS18_010395, partial [Coniosporium uncinatum]